MSRRHHTAVRCTGPHCGKSIQAVRRDTKYCSERCRYNTRAENAKFETPHIPQSGVVGITFNRIRQRWEVRVPEDGKLKYVGSFTSLTSAKQFYSEVLGTTPHATAAV